MVKTKVSDYELVDIGIDHPDYFSGFGVSCTEYTDCVTGIGNTPREALDNCFDQLAWHQDIDWEDLEKRVLEEYPAFSTEGHTPNVGEKYGSETEMQYYIGIRWLV